MTHDELEKDIKQWVDDGRPLNDWDGTLEDQKRACVKYWLRLTPDRRQQIKTEYERKISIEKGTYKPGIYGVWAPKGKSFSDPRPYPAQFPWMLKAWEQGLAWLNELIEFYDNNKL